jgi:hypothetical protein
VTRLTASLLYAGRLLGAQFDSTVAWGRNRQSLESPSSEGEPHSDHDPDRITHALLGEATFRYPKHHAIVLRLERAQQDELFGPGDPRHEESFPVVRFTTGYVFDGMRIPWVRIGIGGAASFGHVPEVIREDYDGPPVSALGFVRVSVE